MNIVKATKQYEDWLGLHIRIVEPDLQFKHEQMAAALFPFFRATFYRWLQVWPEECAELDRVPHILSVGDLHVENFGTWRDSDGRLIWGINDFDEASWLPYTNDLVRLLASANVAIDLPDAIAGSSFDLISGYECCRARIEDGQCHELVITPESIMNILKVAHDLLTVAAGRRIGPSVCNREQYEMEGLAI